MSTLTKIASIIVVLIILAAGAAAAIRFTFGYQVDTGEVGLLIHYNEQMHGTPHIDTIAPNSFIWYNPGNGERVFEYPVALQSLVMVQNAAEGQQQGDDSVQFQATQGVPLKIDVTAQWRVTNPAKLYTLMPGVPLDGNFNHDISSLLLRQAIKHAVNQEGGRYDWDQMTNNENTMEQAMLRELTPALADYGIHIEHLFLGEVHYSPQQQHAIDALATAQQQAQQAQFEVQKQRYLAQAAHVQAQSQADQIRIINEQLSKSPSYMQYLLIQMYREKWDGHLPGVLASDSKGDIILTPFQPSTGK